jgi:hypothetical protein
MRETTTAPPTGEAVRDHLIAALQADLIGPFAGPTDAPEVLQLPPSRWYLTGFLAPEAGRIVDDPTADDELPAGDDDEGDEGSDAEPLPKQRKIFPASIGLSVLIPPGADGPLTTTLTWAEYTEDKVDTDPQLDGPDRKAKTVKVWVRRPCGPALTLVPLDPESLAAGVPVTGAPGIWLIGQIQAADGQGLPSGARALSLFVVNRRAVPEIARAEEHFLFQVALTVEHPAGFLPRPNRTGERSDDFDDRVADLHYRAHTELVVGHGVAAEPDPQAPQVQGWPTRVRTTWLPQAEVRRVKTHLEPGVETRMDHLAEITDAQGAEHKLGRLVSAYGAWLAAQAQIPLDSEDRRATQSALLRRGEAARARIAGGIALLGSDPELRRAFSLANQAMAMASRQRFGPDSTPTWHLFQLAFLLQNLAGIADPDDPSREDVELIFFPTGGGKTEAYLGVIAFTLALRRIRGQNRPDAGLGVAVLLRYTLRLLTLDQLGRAAALICALELLRQRSPHELGAERLAIGLWVGRSATANTLADVATKVTDYRNSRGPSPFPLTKCPWCAREITPDSLTLWPKVTKPEEVRVGCINPDCAFSGRHNRDGLPILFVDEQVYRELPAFVIATVDKFAMMPWRGETALLFGRASASEGRRFHGPLGARPPRGATPLPHGLRPPELIVQDELHLISGPLGTMVGLYEAAIEQLCARPGPDGRPIRPKILASTATVRRASKQIQALFGRAATNLFPPPGVDAFESWFATVDPHGSGRRYVGVAAPGRAMKAILLRTYVALLGAAAHAYDPKGPPTQAADAYMTLAGYFNSLRELGGMRRLVEDDVRTRAATAEARRPRDHHKKQAHPWVLSRDLREPVELTSRVATAGIAAAKSRLESPHASKERVDVLLASNMISVGVDIDRLGLMVVAGQPKTTSEYIQASSRVGRQRQWPGLVVTCFNVHKPRDRSHFERFVAYHDSFYRYVEAQSLTPFSTPALDRGLAGVLTALIRLGEPALTPPEAVMDIARHRAFADAMAAVLAARAGAQPGLVFDRDAEVQRLQGLAQSLLDAWTQVVTSASQEGAARRCYSPYDRPRPQGKPLLHTAADRSEDATAMTPDEARFCAQTSMRDVEASVHLWVERLQLGGRR